MAKPLRAVGQDEKPATPMTVSEALKSGTKLDVLEAQSRVLASAVDDPTTSKRDLAALTKRLMDSLEEIEAARAVAAKEAAEGADATPDDAWEAV